MSTTADQLWEQVLSHLQVQLSRPTFETWIKTAKPESLDERSFVIQTPNTFARNWLHKNYVTTIETIVEGILGHPLDIRISVSTESADIATPPPSEAPPSFPPSPPIAIERPTSVLTGDLNPKNNFSRFVVGANNRMAHAAALAVAEMPGQAYNPMFLCGGVGLGKTHLMQAIGHYRLEATPNSKIAYVSTERFTNDLVDAIRRDSMQAFREHYRDVDILMVDDLQFIEGKEYTQEEFFHTFNTLHERGKQIVLAADRSPHLIPNLQERLCSRFSMGLIAEIQTPDIETRMAILQKKAEYEGMQLPSAVIEYIASTYASNIRELEGALIRAVAYVSISGLAMTVDNIQPILSPPLETQDVTPESVLDVVCQEFSLNQEDLLSSSRKRNISQARQLAMYLMRIHTGLSLPKIGEAFGGKDHTTVLYSCDKVSQQLEKDPQLVRQVQQLGDRLRLAARN
ncbi:MAG: chromosomal replication initiator protein DnaA [Cyanobacteria bacterium J06639_1]